MKILVIGGTYFLGRAFTIFARKREDLQITLLNRGTWSFGDEKIREVRGERTNASVLAGLSEEDFDTVVDFCGYHAGEIRFIFDHLQCRFRQYIFISTVDVLKHRTGNRLNENDPYEDTLLGGEIGEYIRNKIELEKELKECCSRKGCAFTIVRPVSLYGPFNYAPREAQYIKYIIDGESFVYPKDAPGTFQMLYVGDAARMILALCGNKDAFDGIFHLAPEEKTGYLSFLEILYMVSDQPVKAKMTPLKDILARKQFLPYPALAEESEYYTGSEITRVTGLTYTPLIDGMQHTYRSFKRAWQR